MLKGAKIIIFPNAKAAVGSMLPKKSSLELMSRSLLNIAKRSLLRLMLSCVGLASKHAAG